MVCAGEDLSPSSSSRSNSDLEIGCLVDLATGLLSFTANGKDLSTVYQVNKNENDAAFSSFFRTETLDISVHRGSLLPSEAFIAQGFF